jgi:hypothetical protein
MDSLKTLWQENRGSIWSFYCPQCKIPRRVPYRPKPGLKHYAQIGLTAVVFMMLTWNWFDWKGLVAFIPIWVIFETIYRARVRAALNCENCGFDPILYLVDTKRARREIEAHWQKKFEEKGIPYPPVQKAQKTAERLARTPASIKNPVGIEEELANNSGSSKTQ